ncbi:hypothetical protein cypCar_00011690 [Cyprinus carpio]|nr:hypothetical protein cypCar_00011690 [Cyprinus carpio]
MIESGFEGWFNFIASPPRVSTQDLQNASVLVLANKQDMKNSMSAAEISQSLTLGSLNARSWHVQACCALTGEGLPASLDWMRSRVVAN